MGLYDGLKGFGFAKLRGVTWTQEPRTLAAFEILIGETIPLTSDGS